MAAEEQKHSSIKEEVKTLDEKYQQTKKEFEVCVNVSWIMAVSIFLISF
jgi:hypothetical protein